MDIENIIAKVEHRKPSILGVDSFAKYSILLPLIKKNDEIHVLFEVRSYQLRRQPGEVCFPGGKIDDSDKDPQQTAIRETTEELGLEIRNLSCVSSLDYIISPFGTVIYPFLGIIEDENLIKPNPSEVAEVFTVPLSFFKEVEPECYKVNVKMEPEKDFPFHFIVGGKNYKWQTPHLDEYFYYYEKYVIWGLTANIIRHFIEIMNGSDH